MKENEIEQLWYTWTDVGIEESRLGFQVRAASSGLTGRQWSFYQSIRSLAAYQLPIDVDPDVVNAPVCLALVNSPDGKLLIHKVHIQRDRFGRSGNYFTHILFGLPDHFTARDAIRLWQSSIWQTHDVPEDIQPVRLPTLQVTELEQAQQTFHFEAVQDQLRQLIRMYLAPNRLQQRLLITGPSEYIVTLIWGLTHSIPVTLLPPELTFITYEPDVHTSNETIVGKTTAQQLQRGQPPRRSIGLTHEPEEYSRADVEDGITAYANFAVDCLAQTTDGRSHVLDSLVEQAEALSVSRVQTFLQLFREMTAEPRSPSSEQPDSKVQADLSPVQTTSPVRPSPPLSSPPLSSPAHFEDKSVVVGRRPLFIQSERLAAAARSNRTLLLVASLIALLLITNFLTYRIASTSTNQASTGAVIASQATKIAQLSLTVTALAANPAGNNNDGIIGYSVPPPIIANKRFSINVIVRINEIKTLSDESGYQLMCYNSGNQDCKNQQFQGFIGDAISPNHIYVLSIVLTARFNNERNRIYLQLVRNGNLIGSQVKVEFSVQAA